MYTQEEIGEQVSKKNRKRRIVGGYGFGKRTYILGET